MSFAIAPAGASASRPCSRDGLPCGIDATKVTLLLASSLTVMSGALVAPALPAIASHFADVERVGLLTRMLLTLPALGIVVGAPLAGAYLDRNRRRPILLAALVGYAVAGVSGFAIGNLYLLLASRFLLGLAVAVILPTAVALVGDYYAGEERTRFLGTQAAFMALGGTVFVAVSGALAEAGWRYVFLVYASALAVAAMAYRYLPEPTRAEASAAETEAAAAPLSPWVWFAYACVLVGMVVFYLIPVQSPFVMEAVGVSSESLLGIGLIAGTLAAAAVSANYARLRRYVSAPTVFALSFAGMGVGYVVIGAWATLAGALFGSVVAGAAAGLLMPNGNNWLIDLAAPARRGKVLGGMTTAVFVGQFASPLAFQPVIEAAGGLLPAHGWFGAGAIGVGAVAWAVGRRAG